MFPTLGITDPRELWNDHRGSLNSLIHSLYLFIVCVFIVYSLSVYSLCIHCHMYSLSVDRVFYATKHTIFVLDFQVHMNYTVYHIKKSLYSLIHFASQ